MYSVFHTKTSDGSTFLSDSGIKAEITPECAAKLVLEADMINPYCGLFNDIEIHIPEYSGVCLDTECEINSEEFGVKELCNALFECVEARGFPHFGDGDEELLLMYKSGIKPPVLISDASFPYEYMYFVICDKLKGVYNKSGGCCDKIRRGLIQTHCIAEYTGIKPEIQFKRLSKSIVHNRIFMCEVLDILYDIFLTTAAPLGRLIKKEMLKDLIKDAENGSLTASRIVLYFIRLNYWMEKYNVNIL